MTPLANTTNLVFGISTVVIQISSLLLIVMLITKDRGPLAKWLAEHALMLIAVILGGSMFGSLFYSEVIGFKPCLLCWYQRIAIFGGAIVSFVALAKKHSKEAFAYIGTLSVLGAIIAIIHVFSRTTDSEIFNCTASGPSCLQELFKVFRYIDIPVMSLSALLLVILLIVNRRRFA